MTKKDQIKTSFEKKKKTTLTIWKKAIYKYLHFSSSELQILQRAHEVKKEYLLIKKIFELNRVLLFQTAENMILFSKYIETYGVE